RLVSGISWSIPVVVRRGSVDRRQAGRQRRLGLRAPRAGAWTGQSSSYTGRPEVHEDARNAAHAAEIPGQQGVQGHKGSEEGGDTNHEGGDPTFEGDDSASEGRQARVTCSGSPERGTESDRAPATHAATADNRASRAHQRPTRLPVVRRRP